MWHACMWTLIQSQPNVHVHVHVLGHLTVFEWNSSLVLLSVVFAWLLAGLVTFKKRALYYILSHTHTQRCTCTRIPVVITCVVFTVTEPTCVIHSQYISVYYTCACWRPTCTCCTCTCMLTYVGRTLAHDSWQSCQAAPVECCQPYSGCQEGWWYWCVGLWREGG